MTSIYGGRGTSSGGSIYGRSGGAVGGDVPTKKKSGHHGLFGIPHILGKTVHNPVGHVLGKAGQDLYGVGVSSPAGVAGLLGAAMHDSARLGSHVPGSSQTTKDLGKGRYQLPVIGKSFVAQTVQDFQHPLRHPGYTALDLLGLASLGAGTAARGAAALGKLGETGKVSEALAAAFRPPPPLPRVLRATTGVGRPIHVEKPAARAALTRYVQRHIDYLRNTFPEARVGLHTQNTRVGKILATQRATEYRTATNAAKTLLVAGRKVKWDSAEGMAMRAVAHETPLSTMREFWQKELASASTRYQVKSIRKNIALTQAAERFVHDVGGKPEFRPGATVGRIGKKDLQQLVDQAEKVQSDLDKQLIALGESPEMMAGGISAPGRVFRGAKWEAPSLFNPEGGLTGAEDFTGGRFHVGTERRNKPFSIYKEARGGNRDTLGVGQQPGRLTHPMTGYNVRKGAIRHDVPAIVAEQNLESAKSIALDNAREFFIEHAKDTPEGIAPGHAVAIRIEEMGPEGGMSVPRLPAEVKDFQDANRQMRQLAGRREALRGLLYEDRRQRVFPDISAENVTQHAGVKWIDGRLLGGLNDPPLLATMMSKHPHLFAVPDAINNASKMAILYLKPAYAAPNMFGNAFLTLVQQGFAAPLNAKRSVQIWRKLDSADQQLILDHMGEGIATSLTSSGGIGAKAVGKAAKGWSYVVDEPFRISSFIYEARRELGRGAKWQEIRSLLRDESKRPQLNRVVDQANRALINYSDLTPLEREVIRRVIFFYPWVKGSTKYVGYIAGEHPVASAVLGNLGQYGQQRQQQLGPLPSWGMGLIPAGEGKTLNPTAAGVLSQPAQNAAVLADFLSRPRARSAYELSGTFTPALQAAIQASIGAQPGGFSGPEGIGALGSLTDVPLVNLVKALQGKHGKSFPVTPEQALMIYLFGSALVPRNTSLPQLHKSHYAELQPKR